jgi:Domain of unknown function (DUF1906)
MTGLRNAGITFACRYVSPDRTGKNLTVGEANALKASGIDIVTNWEWGEHDPLNGRAQGISDASRAINMAADLGAPSHAPVYLSVDFDAQDSDMRQIAAYFDGATSAIGWERVGVYGGYRVVANMAATNRCKYFWQTYAWSGGRWHNAANIRQVQNRVIVGGAEVDIDQSMTGDYGSWSGVTVQSGLNPISAGPWDPSPVLFAVGDWLNQGAARLNEQANIIRSLPS